MLLSCSMNSFKNKLERLEKTGPRPFATIKKHIAESLGYWREYIDNARRASHHRATNPAARSSNSDQRKLNFPIQWDPEAITETSHTFSYNDLKNNDVILYLWAWHNGEIQIIQNNDIWQATIRRSVKWGYSLENYEITLSKGECIIISNKVLDMLLDKREALKVLWEFWWCLYEKYQGFINNFPWIIIGSLHQSIQSHHNHIDSDDYQHWIYAISHTGKQIKIDVIKECDQASTTKKDHLHYQFVNKNCDLPLDWWNKGINFVE